MTESGEAVVTHARGGRRRATARTHIGYASKEARDAALATGMTDGTEMSYRRLDELLAHARG